MGKQNSPVGNLDTFRISSALKDLIGRELITDEFVAVFELVKNSFDANATQVKVVFDTTKGEDIDRISIIDNGKGMNSIDLEKKWLFVAYSAKKDGSENSGYRDKIKVTRLFAGAKGVGRFSCDRLGRFLELITKKDEKNAKVENIIINWEDFESNPLNEFVDVKISHKNLSDFVTDPYSFSSGTKLIITGVRDIWDRERLIRLKKSLAKLINPNQENDSVNFDIELVVPSQKNADNATSLSFNKVNGSVKNEIFESLKIKTTLIKVEISNDGKTVQTTLEDRGDLIFTLLEKNVFSNTLRDIKFHLFQLNRSAKASFTRDMGIEVKNYGSVFMYKNGFRIYPFGEPGEDLLLIDNRKQQGYNRFLGTRDVIGRIEINGNNDELHETTSRDGGLVKTPTYSDMVDFFYQFVLSRLENYAVNIIKWGDEKFDKQTGELIHPELWPEDVKIQILELITGFIKSDNIINVHYDKDFLNIIESKQDKSVEKIIKNISKIGSESKNPEIVREAQKIGKVVKDLKKDNVKLSKANEGLRSETQEIKERLGYAIGQNLFLNDSVKIDTKELQSLLHHTEKSTYWVNRYIENLINGIENGDPKEKLFETISQISWENQKIFSFTKYHKSTQFNTFVKKISQDIVAFINQYLNNVCKFYEEYEQLNIEITTPADLIFLKSFSPVEVPIIFDNLLNNSKKAGARKIEFIWTSISNEEVSLDIVDDGKGIPDAIANNVFDFRFTTTRGSGLGLYHVNKVINSMKGSISVNQNVKTGAGFTIFLKK